MKKLILVILVLTLTLSACGGDDGERAPSSVDERPAQEQQAPNEPPTNGQAPAQGQQPLNGPPPAGQAPAQGQTALNEPSSDAAPAQAQPVAALQAPSSGTNAYTVVDTAQDKCYDASSETPCPQQGQAFYGQDAQYAGVQPRYVDNGDGTVTDLNTGLMWQQTPDLDHKSTYPQAVAGAETFDLAGYDDWRLPSIKELYSLVDFNGSQFTKTPYIDTDYFDFVYGDESQGERAIDAQYWSSNEYVGTVFGGMPAVFGVNFADGRIKGYGLDGRNGSGKMEFVRYVRGNPGYGVNAFVDNGDNTISDLATGLTWMKDDSGATYNWESALAYCESLEHAGYDDWRLPNAKELQSIVDYDRAPDAQNAAQQGAAIDPIFELSETESWFWTSTTLQESPPDIGSGSQAVYLAFGQAFGVQNNALLNVHGAGAQRSDPKSGDPAGWADGHGPQGDQIRIYNYARCARNGAQFVEVTNSGAGEAAVQQPSGNQPAGSGQPPVGAQGQGPAGGGAPPPEAINACSGLSENASCQFTAPQGLVSGVCSLIQSQLACVPEGGPPAGSP